MEQQFREDETVADLLGIKSRVEKSIANLNEEKEKVKSRLNLIKDLKATERKKRTDEHLKMYRIKIALVDAKKRITTHQTYMNKLTETMKMIEGGIKEKMQLKTFEQPLLQLNGSIEGAISFYSEENLQMELAKRDNIVRERRVEYTRLESEINDTNRRIEDKKREEERIRLINLERARLAEEHAKRQEEERAQADEARLREHYRQMSLKPTEPNQSFLVDNFNMAPTKIQEFTIPKSSTSSINESEAASTGPSSENEISSAVNSSAIPNLSFSQFMRW